MNVTIQPAISTCITVIAFKRPQLLLDTLTALRYNFGIGAIPLYVYIDGARKDKKEEKKAVAHTVRVAQQFEWQGAKHVIASKSNRGLQHGVRFAIDTSLQNYESTIIVEDDIVTSPFFLKFMVQGLEMYAHDERVAAICGNVYPFNRKLCNPTSVFFLNHFACWGWATWKRSWKHVCWDTGALLQRLKQRTLLKELNFGIGSHVSDLLEHQHAHIIDTWDVQTNVSFFLNGQYCLYPPEALIQNIGWRIDSGSTHTNFSSNPNAPMAYCEFVLPPNIEVTPSPHVQHAINRMWYPFPKKIKYLIRNTLFRIFPFLKKLRITQLKTT